MNKWYSNIPDLWKEVPLFSVVEEINIKNNPIIFNNVLSLTNTRGVIPYEEKGNQGNISKTDVSQYKIAYKDTIIINSMNLKIGSVGYSNYDGCVSPVYYVIKAKDKALTKYISYLFQTNFQKYLGQYGKGIMEIREKISLYDILHTYIPLPNLNEQKRIVEYLDKKINEIDEIIELSVKEVELLNELKQSYISNLIKHGIGNVERKESGVDYIGKIPTNWNVEKIGRLFEIKKRIAGTEGYDVLSITQKGIMIKDIESNDGQLASDYSKYQFVEIGDFAMNHMDLLTGWIDCSNYFGVTSPDYRVFNFIDSKNKIKEYFLYLFQSFYKEKVFFGFAQGVSDLGRMRLQREQFNSMLIPVPPYEEQKEIVNNIDIEVSKIDDLIKYREKSIEKLNEYKKSLIYEVVIGKKEV